MRGEGRGQDPVGGVRDAGQLLCHGDSGEGEEEEGWRDTSLQKAARPPGSPVSLQPLQQIEQGHSCCTDRRLAQPGRANSPGRQALGLEALSAFIPPLQQTDPC